MDVVVLPAPPPFGDSQPNIDWFNTVGFNKCKVKFIYGTLYKTFTQVRLDTKETLTRLITKNKTSLF